MSRSPHRAAPSPAPPTPLLYPHKTALGTQTPASPKGIRAAKTIAASTDTYDDHDSPNRGPASAAAHTAPAPHGSAASNTRARPRRKHHKPNPSLDPRSPHQSAPRFARILLLHSQNPA